MTVYLVLNKDGIVMSVNASGEKAHEKVNRYNSDPFLGPGIPDPHAPYHVESWSVQEDG